jgi:hypothetical protein
MSPSDMPSSSVDASSFAYVVGIDIGSQSCDFCVLKPDKSQVIKPTTFANARSGFEVLQSKLAQLHVQARRVLIGLEATSRYGENLYQFLEGQGYQLCLLHPRQAHQFAQQRGLRAKTDQLDATTIARVLLSGEARRGYVATEVIAAYRELVRLHTHLSDEVARYKNEIHALLSVLFPEFSQVFADPCRATALALLTRYPSAQAVASAGVLPLTMVDNSDLSPLRLTASSNSFYDKETLPATHFKQRGFLWPFMYSCFCSWSAFSSLSCYFVSCVGPITILSSREQPRCALHSHDCSSLALQLIASPVVSPRQHRWVQGQPLDLDVLGLR